VRVPDPYPFNMEHATAQLRDVLAGRRGPDDESLAAPGQTLEPAEEEIAVSDQELPEEEWNEGSTVRPWPVGQTPTGPRGGLR